MTSSDFGQFLDPPAPPNPVTSKSTVPPLFGRPNLRIATPPLLPAIIGTYSIQKVV